MRSENLIDQLSTNLQAVKPFSPLRNTVVWSVVSLALVGASVALLPLRNFSDFFAQPMALISSLWLVVNSIFFAYAANVVGQPGRRNQGLIFSLSLAIYLLLIGVLIGAALSAKNTITLSELECFFCVVGLSLMPLIFFFRRVRNLAPTSPWLMGLTLGLSTCALGAFGLSFSCSDEEPLHLLSFHVIGPAILLGGVGAFLGQKFLKW